MVSTALFQGDSIWPSVGKKCSRQRKVIAFQWSELPISRGMQASGLVGARFFMSLKILNPARGLSVSPLTFKASGRRGSQIRGHLLMF